VGYREGTVNLGRKGWLRLGKTVRGKIGWYFLLCFTRLGSMVLMLGFEVVFGR